MLAARAAARATAAATATPRAASSSSAVAAVTVAAARGYATPSSSAPDSKPPIQVFGLDGTYASALYTAAAKSSTLEPTAKAMATLRSRFAADPKLATVLTAPTLSKGDKGGIVAELLKTAGVPESAKEGATVRNFLATLADNNRLALLDGACAKFEQLMGAARGEVELRVTSAEELDRRVLQRLEQTVQKSKYVGAGRKLKVVPKVSPDIRGGLIVEIGDRTIDLSVASKMSRMNKLLQDTL